MGEEGKVVVRRQGQRLLGQVTWAKSTVTGKAAGGKCDWGTRVGGIPSQLPPGCPTAAMVGMNLKQPSKGNNKIYKFSLYRP